MNSDLPPWSSQAQLMQPGMYRHYKGDVYEILGIARHSETLEELVVYKHDGNFWVRPIAMFFQEVEFEGKNVLRFVRL